MLSVGAAVWHAAQHFSVTNCVRGLAVLCESLFGVRVSLRPVPAAEAWTWAGGRGSGAGGGEVHRLELSHPVSVSGERGRPRTGGALGCLGGVARCCALL